MMFDIWYIVIDVSSNDNYTYIHDAKVTRLYEL